MQILALGPAKGLQHWKWQGAPVYPQLLLALAVLLSKED